MKFIRCITTRTISSGRSSSGSMRNGMRCRSSGISNGLNSSLRFWSFQCVPTLLRWLSEQSHGWLIPPEWEFQSEVWEYKRKRESEVMYDHENEVTIIHQMIGKRPKSISFIQKILLNRQVSYFFSFFVKICLLFAKKRVFKG